MIPNLRQRPDLAALGFCALVVVCVTVLAYGRVPVPDFLPMIGLVIAGAGAGVALNDQPREPLPRATPRRTAPAPAVPAPRLTEPAPSEPLPPVVPTVGARNQGEY